MANNFDLRQFLTENKLTKNAQLLKEEVSLNGKPVDIRSIEIDGIDMNDYPDFVDAYIVAADFEDGTPLTDDEVQQFQDENYDLVGELIHDRQLYLEGEGVNEAKSYKVSKNSKEAQHLKKGDIIGSGDEVVSVSAGAKTPSGKVEVTLKTKAGKTKTSIMGKTTKVGVKEKETVKENTMTQREKYLTRLVENALGLEVAEDDNVDYTMGRHDDPNQLPNPAPELNIPEGDEMANETVIPEYNSIDELMKSIDHGTNEVAEKHKMEQMKKIAEALRMKAKKMEESEHAAHISPKDLKQLATDAAKLEKAAEKLKAAFDKKFNKKEKPASTPKAEKVEALQETTMENFNLKKFLIENKLTTNSRMLSEEVIDFTNREQYTDFLQNKTGELEGKKVKLNIFDTYANGETEKQNFTGNILVNLEKRTSGTGTLKYNATLIDDGGYRYIAPLKGKKIQISIPTTTGGKGGFGDEDDTVDGISGIFQVKTLEIIG